MASQWIAWRIIACLKYEVCSPKNRIQRQMGFTGAQERVVKPRIVTVVALHQQPGRRHLMRIKDRAPLLRFVQLRRKCDRQSQPLVGNDHPLVRRQPVVNAQRLEAGKERLGDRHIEVVLKIEVVAKTLDTVGFPQEIAESLHVPHMRIAGIDQQNLMLHISETAPSIK